MSVHVIADTANRLSTLRAMLQEQYAVTSELLGDAKAPRIEADALVAAADLRSVDNIAALREAFARLTHIRKRIFLVDQNAHLFIVQAYALGATRVLGASVDQANLLAQLADSGLSGIRPNDAAHGAREAAAAGAIAIGSMFSAVLARKAIDVTGAKGAANGIADSIAESGLSSWLETVRGHHEGTYQHCLLVTGIAVDFGLSLGFGRRDLRATAVGGDISRHRQGKDSARDS